MANEKQIELLEKIEEAHKVCVYAYKCHLADPENERKEQYWLNKESYMHGLLSAYRITYGRKLFACKDDIAFEIRLAKEIA